MESVFTTHREMVLGHYGTAAWLRRLVLAMWNGTSYPVGMSALTGLDANHAAAAFEMMQSYRANGENDKAFMALAHECISRAEQEQAAAERAADLESWMAATGRALRSVGLRSGLVDDKYSWFEDKFDAGIEPGAAAETAKASNLGAELE